MPKRDESLAALFRRKKGIEQGTNEGKTVVGEEPGFQQVDEDRTVKESERKRRARLVK